MMSRVAMFLALLAVAWVCMNSVKAQDCPGLNQEYRDCSTECEPTCANPNPTCIEECGPGACQCIIGFVRNHKGVCVPLKDC